MARYGGGFLDGVSAVLGCIIDAILTVLAFVYCWIVWPAISLGMLGLLVVVWFCIGEVASGFAEGVCSEGAKGCGRGLGWLLGMYVPYAVYRAVMEKFHRDGPPD